MEFLNQIHLRGIVGTLRTSQLSDTTVTRMSVATNLITTINGMIVQETEWHEVTAFGDAFQNCEPSQFTPGSSVEVIGRLKRNRYTSSDGEERTATEIRAVSVMAIEERLETPRIIK